MEKQRWEESEKRRAEERRSEKRKSQKKEDAGARKGRKSRNTVFFRWFVAPEGRKVGLLKRRVRSHLARWEAGKKLHAVMARSTCGSQNVQSTRRSDVVLRGRRKGFRALPEGNKTWEFCSMSKNDGRIGIFAEDLTRWISRGRRSTRDMFIRDVRRSGR